MTMRVIETKHRVDSDTRFADCYTACVYRWQCFPHIDFPKPSLSGRSRLRERNAEKSSARMCRSATGFGRARFRRRSLPCLQTVITSGLPVTR